MKDQRRNLNPTPEARAAMWLWPSHYARSAAGSMDYYDTLGHGAKRMCTDLVKDILGAAVNHGRVHEGPAIPNGRAATRKKQAPRKGVGSNRVRRKNVRG